MLPAQALLKPSPVWAASIFGRGTSAKLPAVIPVCPMHSSITVCGW